MIDDRQTKGEALRTRLFGPASPAPDHPRNQQHASLPERIQRQTNDHLFGEIWQTPGLSIEERSLITCAVLTAMGRSEQLRGHMSGALNLGIPREKLDAMIEHVMYYAGWPSGMTGFRILREVSDALEGHTP